MNTITQLQFDNYPSDYKGVWTNDHWHGTNFNGKKTIILYNTGGTTLLIENVSFIIVSSNELNTNPIIK